MIKSPRFILAILTLVFLCGCYVEKEKDGAIEFSYQFWVPALIILGSLLAIPYGIAALGRQRLRHGLVLLVIGVLGVTVGGPNMFFDKVVVNESGFLSRRGMWWNPTIFDIHYADLSQAEVKKEQSVGRRPKMKYFLVCTRKNNKQDKIPIDEFMIEAIPKILAKFAENNVKVFLPTDLE